MPSGRTHDVITLIIAPPTFVAAWGLTGSYLLASVATCATLFGGLMFGPDLDILSRQYTRWGVFRFLWLPYRAVFRHRSRWSHGIIFGTLIRVIYFALMLTLLISAGIYLRALITAGGVAPGWEEVVSAWRSIEAGVAASGVRVDKNLAYATFAGLWWGAASHTLTDVAWSVVRKGSEIF
ncbi:MAG TPA: metal-binding protein [Pyrinomonadaceae bacterium]|nr:metal-binding protein [Pyrinomonadaceae bacterium]